MEEKLFNFNKFWGNPQIGRHVVFGRNLDMYCVYCSERADTREHCPSRTFLKKPYPIDLPTVPACKKCNNGFSMDERYTKKVIETFYSYYILRDDRAIVVEPSDDNDVRNAKEAVDRFLRETYFDDRMAFLGNWQYVMRLMK